MRKIWDIYRLDIKNIVTNMSILIVIGGLIFLPSLYAWFNIKASWDPYGQTDQIPIGVVNEDEGATIRDEDINVGKDLVENLKENDAMNWKFVDREKAMSEVEYGNYYAVITIPKNFSEKLATVTSGEPEKAEMDYYVNEKINAIAPKITDKGVSVIVEEISSEFISTVNGAIFDMFNEIGLELEEDYPDIQNFKEYVFNMEEELPKIHDTLLDTEGDADDADKLIKNALGKVPEAESILDDGLSQIDKALKVLGNIEDEVNEMSPKIEKELKSIQSKVHEVNDAIKELDGSDISFSDLQTGIDDIDEDISKFREKLSSIEDTLTSVQSGLQDGAAGESEEKPAEEEENEDEENNDEEAPVEDNVNNLEEEKENIQAVIDEIQAMDETLGKIQSESKEIHQFVEDVEKDVKEKIDFDGIPTDKVDELVTVYTDEIVPTLTEEIKNAKGTLQEAKGMVVDIKDAIPEVKRLLNNTNDHLGEGQELLTDVLNEYPYVNDKVKETADKIRDLEDETDLNEIIGLLKNDPESEKGFFSEPVKLHKNEIFPIKNYGTGMTPFYTVLAFWVGGLLLISLLTTDITDDPNIKPRHMYFGRLFTFLTIGFFQAIIAILGNLFILKVEVSSILAFIGFGLIVGAVFMTIIYTVVSIFGDVGKAMIIILLVLQIAGSGGTYPVVLLPKFFQMINPLLPFTYAVDLMREAVGGIVTKRVIRDLVVLLGFGSAFVLIGAFLKAPLNKLMSKVMGSKGSRLFH